MGSLTRRGVGLYKDVLSIQDEIDIRKALTVKPFQIPNAMQQTTPFSIYRESNKKIYVPRFFGKSDYNIPIDPHIIDSTSSNIDIEFNGSLRPYQNAIVQRYMDETHKSGCGLLEIPCGRGKCLGYNTPIMMKTGMTKMVQDIQNGDILMGDDCSRRIVYGTTKGYGNMYRVIQSSGITYRVNDVHILTLYDTIQDKVIDIDVTSVFVSDMYKRGKFKGVNVDITSKQLYYTDIVIEYDGEDNYYGFCVDNNHRFLLGDGTVTHNTVMALNIISKLKKKTLVIVHKEFLLNQWIDRIEQFLPRAKIGRIQGKVIDLDGKDIVIGMLQSLSLKSYPKETFDTFGLTIIDECHHICAEVFSRSLFKIVTPYMLGLSATMERKDRLSYVFKMFLGDVIYKEVRSGKDDVEVRSVYYESMYDEEYSRIEYNFKGQTHYSKMIKKLCEYPYRTEFIVSVVDSVMKEDDTRQLMILAHNKSLLYGIEEELKKHNVDKQFDVGYYVGGMKEVELKNTEEKRIILATYAMAEEALDIKSLSALLLATPKTDVTQAVGRILRMKHANPLVIDIVDEHDIFKKQWMKRKRYYKKCNYLINQIHANTYYDKNTWNVIHDPTRTNTKSKMKNDVIIPNDEKMTSAFSSGKCLIHVDTL